MPCSALPLIPGAANLRDFVSGVRDCTAGTAARSVSTGPSEGKGHPQDTSDWDNWDPNDGHDASGDPVDDVPDDWPAEEQENLAAYEDAIARAQISWLTVYGVGLDEEHTGWEPLKEA